MVDVSGLDLQVPCFPVAPGVQSGCVAQCSDGRFLYVYASAGTGQIREVLFETIFDLAQGITVNPFDVYRRGKPVEDSDQAIIMSSQHGRCAVWQDGTSLWLSAIYVAFDPEDGDVLKLYNEIWESPSGNGGDWGKASDVQSALPAGSQNVAHYAGRGTAGVGLDGVMPQMSWMTGGLGYVVAAKIPSVYYGQRDQWQLGKQVGYYIGDLYGYYTSRRTVIHSGTNWVATGGNVSPYRGLTGGGSHWDIYDETLPDYPGVHEHSYIASGHGGVLRMGSYRRPGLGLRPPIEVSSNPSGGVWVRVTESLHMGNIAANQWGNPIGAFSGWMWCDAGPRGLLVNDDKVWLPMGGWVLGAMGRS